MQINSDLINKATLNTYSTEEHIVGTFEDGKPLYERTIVLQNITISGNELAILDKTNYEVVLLKNYYINGDQSSSQGNRHSFVESTNDGTYYFHIKAFRNNVFIATNLCKYINKGYITIRYTKISD